MLIEEFITQSNKAVTSRQAVVLWHQAMAELGLDRQLFTLLTEHRTIGRKAGPVAASRYPQAWLTEYCASQFEKIDPVYNHMRVTKGAFTWDSLKLTPGQASMMAMAERAGLYNGIGISLRGPQGELAGVMAASSVQRPPWNADMLDCVDFITQQFYKVFLRLEYKTKASGAIRLTGKERQVLILCAQGRSRAEIAGVMGVSADTVKFHLKGIFGKLKASNQQNAVLKAMRMGLISSEPV